MATAGLRVRGTRGGKRPSEARKKKARGSGAAALRGFVPKVPRLIQQSVDQLIEKAQAEGLTRREQRLLNEVLDYLADLTIRELERMRDTRRRRHAV